VTDDPYLGFARALALFYQPPRPRRDSPAGVCGGHGRGGRTYSLQSQTAGFARLGGHIAPILRRGVLLDIAGLQGGSPENFEIAPDI